MSMNFWTTAIISPAGPNGSSRCRRTGSGRATAARPPSRWPTARERSRCSRRARTRSSAPPSCSSPRNTPSSWTSPEVRPAKGPSGISWRRSKSRTRRCGPPSITRRKVSSSTPGVLIPSQGGKCRSTRRTSFSPITERVASWPSQPMTSATSNSPKSIPCRLSW